MLKPSYDSEKYFLLLSIVIENNKFQYIHWMSLWLIFFNIKALKNKKFHPMKSCLKNRRIIVFVLFLALVTLANQTLLIASPAINPFD